MYRNIFYITIVTLVFSAPVDIDRATQIAENFFNSRNNNFEIVDTQEYIDDSRTSFYIFSLAPRGFIIVSANDAAMPILAYSFQNNFSLEQTPIQVEYLLNMYKEEIAILFDNNITANDEILSAWNLYSDSFIYTQDRSVSPLLTCNWNQDSPWNDMCPTDQDGPGGNVYAGCVAISMVQIMYYWGYPEVGYGDHGYNPGSGYGYQYADFENSFYDYSLMENNFATTASQLLIYHAGVSVNMGYSPNGSGASVFGGSNSAYSAMKNYFRYDNAVNRIYPENYSTSEYREILQGDLDNNQPIIYVGYSNEGGHAWNIDGYEDDYFHNNFGWGGSNNGYYLLSSLNGFNSGQGALVNLIPEEIEDPHIVLMDTNYYEMDGDGDNVINPGEQVAFFVTVENFTPWDDANSVTLALESNSEDISIENDTQYIGNLNSGDIYTIVNPYVLNISTDAQLGSHSMILHIIGNDGSYIEDYNVNLDITLFQSGFPYDTFDQIKTNPLVVDLDNDSDYDIIFSDNMGFVHVIESDGTVTNNNFPFEIGDDVWGSISAEDIDLDGDIEFIVASKTKYIYIFDKNGLENTYYADKFLLGSPAIGQIDTDEYYEIVIGGFGPSPTSENPLFVINHDATDTEGFPLIIGEKIRSGVALSDFNNNGYDDIVFGTESNNLYLVYDDGMIAEGFPVSLGDKIQFAPSILSMNDEKIIIVGSKDNHLYSINSSGEIEFSIETDGDICTSPSFIDTEEGLLILFGSENGFVYAVDINGNIIQAWNIGADSIDSIVSSDLDGNNIHEIVVSAGSKISIFSLDNSFPYSEIIHELPLASAPTIIDVNQDGTLEVLVGTGTNLSSVDFKFNSNNISPWNMHRGNNHRTGYFSSIANIMSGDVNQDSIIDILDVVIIINFALSNTFPNDTEFDLSDINSDNQIDVLDIILLVNIILQ